MRLWRMPAWRAVFGGVLLLGSGAWREFGGIDGARRCRYRCHPVCDHIGERDRMRQGQPVWVHQPRDCYGTGGPTPVI